MPLPPLPKWDHILHGGDYNPEQWLHAPHVIEDDFRLMREAGWNTLTLGVFAWAALEPSPGDYRFEWMHSIVERAHQAQMHVVLATPSAAMPVWVAERWPEVLRVGRDGRRMPWSWRQHFCLSSSVYRERVAMMDGALAGEFGSHPAVILWHIGNEFSGACYCPACIAHFQRWLEQRHHDVDTLNQRWCNAVWSHTISDWRQITPFDTSNDGQQLDWQRFVTDLTVEFVRLEIDTVRRHSDRPVTTNFMGIRPGLNYARLADCLDVISDDQYPNYHADDAMPSEASRIAMTQDLMRGMARGKPWMLMETTPSVTNRMRPPKLKRPGIHQLQMTQALAHGADGVLYFQWRQAQGHREKFHGAVVGHDGLGEGFVFQDVADFGRSLRDLQGLAGAYTQAEVALVFDWESWWAMNLSAGPDPVNAPKDDPKGYVATCMDWYRPLWRRGVAVDVVPAGAPLDRYRMVIAPMLFLVDDDAARRLTAFAKAGGCVVATYLAGTVDEYGRCHLGGWPGAGLDSLFGVQVSALDVLGPDDRQAVRCTEQPESGTRWPVRDYAAILRTCGADVVAVYTEDFYAEEPAMTRHTVGDGEAWFAGARTDARSVDGLVGQLIERVAIHVPVAEPPDPPVSVRIRHRTDGCDIFALNFGPVKQTIQISPAPGLDPIRFHLQGFGSTIARLPRATDAGVVAGGQVASNTHKETRQ